ncbi:tetratricopeptide repeat protein [Flavobacterium sp. W22_SRS_FK3]|uniref:tetratricopeptide repeat protein n=1 Tax=Flavobacterium sp. W22_SRS_FK3 TaxID=3240275 RepID=UPI003F8DF1FC
MNIKKQIILVFGFLFGLSVQAQDMQEGFTNLEKGEFAQAETFFKEILKSYPDNKTAKLCYGRAVGLSSSPEKAMVIFSELLKTYPDDFEIQLNYAECMLWNKNYAEAKPYYFSLITKHPESFPALLGYANTLSNLKEYKEALEYVNKALTVSVKNPNALISKKYIRLGYANQFVQQQGYTKALALLDENLEDFPKDKETLMNKANIYLITKDQKNAIKAYHDLAVTKNDSLIALNGLSLVAHIAERNREALSISEKAIEKSEMIEDVKLQNQTKERYVQALIWNKKYKEAETKINQYKVSNPNENWVLALSATLGMYRSDFKASISDYQNILINDAKSFDGNLGISNAYYADGEPLKAYETVDTTLKIFENQKDAVGFLKKLNENFTPSVEEKLSYSFDNGKNEAYATNTLVVFPVSTKWFFIGTYQYRKTENTVTKNSSVSNDFKIGTQWKFHPKINFNILIGSSNANSFTNNYSQLLADIFFKIKPLKLQDLEVGYKRDIQNFNADLVSREITANNFYFNYNIGTNFKLGWFTQYFFTSQSDNNQRNLLFTSLYYNFLSKPILKAGFNYQFITFKDQVPTIYFSPHKFNAYEIFIDFLKDEKAAESKTVFYTLTAATGFQYIENDGKQSTYRVQSKFGYKFSDRFLANIYGVKSNIASATAAGFQYTEIGLRLRWMLASKPVFKVSKNTK